MKKKGNTIGGLLFSILLFCSAGIAQPLPVHDSTLTLERIDAAIAFLQDSQQVAATVQHLKLIADARRALVNKDAVNATRGNTAVTFNIFTAGQQFASGFVRTYHDLIAEVQSLSTQVTSTVGALSQHNVRGRVLTLLIVAVVALIVGLLIGIVLWRFGRRLLESGIPMGKVQHRSAGIAGLVATRSSFGIGGTAALFLISVVTSGTTLQRFFLNAAFAYLFYLTTVTVIATLFSPQRNPLRSIPCSDKAAIQITRRTRWLFRVTLLLYLLHTSATVLNLHGCSTFIANLFQLSMTVMIPLTLFGLRQWYLEPIRRYRQTVSKHRRVLSIVENVLARLHIVLFLYLAVLSGISIAGPAQTYRFFIRGSLQTAGLLVAGGVFVGIWRFLMKYLSGTQMRVLAQYSDLQERITGNLKIAGIAGYVLMCGILLTVFIRIWGIELSELLSSRIPVVQVMLRVVAIVTGSWLLVQAAYFIISRFSKAAQARMLRADSANPVEIEKRISTLSGIFQKIISVTVVVIGVIMVMDQLGFDIKAMVAGVGIVGLAVGFGAQNLVRDVISGLFVIFENKIRVGDVAIINGTGGLVEQVNLRTSVLRSLDGTIHVFPNGTITSLSNMTHEYSYYVFDLGVAYKEDTDRVSAVLKQIGEEIRFEPEYRDAILEPLEILGVDAFADSAVIIKARIKTVPIKQWFVGREMNRRIKRRFDELGIEIPFPHHTLYFGEASRPFAISAMNSDSLRESEVRREDIGKKT